MYAKDITKADLKDNFPTAEVLQKWKCGIDADWPPFDDGDEDDDGLQPVVPFGMPELRFKVGTRVICRTGPDVEKDWCSGTIVFLWYRDKKWPEGSYAPYRVRLDDDREIYAPSDMDQVIKREVVIQVDSPERMSE